MRRAGCEKILPRLALALALAVCPALLVRGSDAAPMAEQPVDDPGEKALLEEISRIESRDGAYAAKLPEQMLSLGLALQQKERHAEAINIFKRGVHLARVNNGLYSAEQVPLLQGEINSAIALREYTLVDQLQQYLYRVQLHGINGGEDRASALLQQATWQFNAYQLGLGAAHGMDRLVTMWDLYRLAWSDIGATHGADSPKLLPPLYGMLRTQYLIRDYQADSDSQGTGFSSGYTTAKTNRFYSYRSENYELGRSVILSIYRIQSHNKGKYSNEAVDALVAMGDWALWSGKREDAAETYRFAQAELAERDDAKEGEQGFFTQPVALPDIKGLRTLPPAVGAEEGNILLEFGVNSRGKVVDLERLDTNEDIDTKAERLMRVLRNTKFRPRYEAGEPVGTDKLVRAYEIKP